MTYYSSRELPSFSRRDQRDLWRRIARTREAAGDKDGARRARTAARLIDSPVKYFCSPCWAVHAQGAHLRVRRGRWTG